MSSAYQHMDTFMESARALSCRRAVVFFAALNVAAIAIQMSLSLSSSTYGLRSDFSSPNSTLSANQLVDTLLEGSTSNASTSFAAVMQEKLSQMQLRSDLAQLYAPPTLPDSRGFVTRGLYQSLFHLCSYSEAELALLLARTSHGCLGANKTPGIDSDRAFLHQGSWHTMSELEKAFQKTEFPGTSCVIGCFSHRMPCLYSTCLIPFHLRRKTSDVLVARQLLVDAELDVARPDYQFNTILDAGGNIGLAAIVFGHAFPTARIISVEAAPDNFEILRLNTARLMGVTAVRAAVWNQTGSLWTCGTQKEAWSYMVVDGNDDAKSKCTKGQKGCNCAEVNALSIPLLSSLHGVDSFDLLKVDIEGSEKEVFSSDDLSFLEATKMVIVETHDRMKKGCADAVKKGTEKAGFAYSGRCGEHEVYVNPKTLL